MLSCLFIREIKPSLNSVCIQTQRFLNYNCCALHIHCTSYKFISAVIGWKDEKNVFKQTFWYNYLWEKNPRELHHNLNFVYLSLYITYNFRNCYKIFYIHVHIGPVASYLVNRWGCRLTAVAGGMLLVAGLIGSYFSRCLRVLIATNGIISGLSLFHSLFYNNITIQ